MSEPASQFLAPWSNFCVMAASSAAALTGLMFIVITLVMGSAGERIQRAPAGISNYSTPTVVHFCAALLFSALLVAPWRSLGVPAILIGLAGLGGIVYVIRITGGLMRFDDYRPDAEDWAWYSVVPLICYAAIFAAAMCLFIVPAKALFILAAGILCLIFVGIRNAWDVVTYVAVGMKRDT